MKKYKSINKKLSMLVATVLLTSPSILANAAGDVETPVTTPVTTPVETPVTTPVETPVTTPVETPVTTPVTTPAETPVTTPVETPVTTPVETHEVGILDAKGNPIKDWSAVTIYKSNGGQPEKEVGIFYADKLEKGIADLKDGAYIAHLEASSSFITFNNNRQIPFSIKNGVLSTDIKFISNEVTGLIDFSSLLESSSYFYVTDSRGNSVKMYAHTNFAIQSLPVGTYTVTKMKNLGETEGATHTITITSGVVKAVGIDDDVPSETPSDVPSETPSDVPSETPSDVPSETPSDVPSENPSEEVPSETPLVSSLKEAPIETPRVTPLEEASIETPRVTLPSKTKTVKTGSTSSMLYLLLAMGSLLGIKQYKPKHAKTK